MSNDFRWYGPDDRGDRSDLHRRDYGADYRRPDDTRGGENRTWREEQRAREDEQHDAWRPFGDTGPTNYGGRSGYGAGQAGRGERQGGDPRRSAFGGDSDYGRGTDRDLGAGYRQDRDGGFTETGGRYSESYRRGQDDYRGPRDDEGRGEEGRGRNWLDKAGDEISSFFSGGGRRGEHRGKGPKGYRRTDERIREDVSDKMAEDAWLDASDIEVGVDNGEVSLTGQVASREDKRRAEDLAERVSGVSNVQNNLRVRRDGTGAYADQEPPRV